MSFALVSGATLGRYHLLVPLGQGGMGSVWVAREESPKSGKERLVAIKVMRPEFATHSSFRAMFLKEGQLVGSIEHDNVVRTYEVAEHDGVLWQTMEWVEGESLDALFREAARRRPIPAEMAVRIIADTAKGLHAAHEMRGWDGELEGIVHRDVSPHNILVGLDGRVKVADFGLAKATESSGMSMTEGPHGKYSYMSPEQARGQAVDRRSDVFSLGVVLYELTTGQRLFKGVDKHHTLGLVMQCKVPPPHSVNPNYSPGLEAIVLRALANNPKDRYQSAEEFRLALERHLVGERTVVSTGSVAALLRRVVGKRLEKRRQAIHDALVNTVGHANSSLIPDTTLLTGSSQVSEVTEPGRAPLSQPTASETPHAISRSRPSLIAPPPPERHAIRKLAAWGGGGAVVAFCLMLAIGKLMSKPTNDAAGTALASQPEATAAQLDLKAARPQSAEPSEPGVQGVSVSDLPVEEVEKRQRATRQWVAPPQPQAQPAPAPKPAWLKEAASEDLSEPAAAEPPPSPYDDSASAPVGELPKEEPQTEDTSDEPTGDPTHPKIVLEEEPAVPKPKVLPKKPEPYKLRVPGADSDGAGF